MSASPAAACILVLLLVSAPPVRGQKPSQLDVAAADFRNGRLTEAEQILKTILGSHPSDFDALMLIGPVLDSQQRYSEAGNYYEQALSLAPESPQILNNAANHFLAAGDETRARELYQRLIAREPHHANANLQLAQLSLNAGQGAAALAFLDHIQAPDHTAANVRLLTARALGQTGHCREAANLLHALERAAASDPQWTYSLGMTFAQCELYRDAERVLAPLARTQMHDFDVQYNYALAAFRSKDFRVAERAFAAASSERPSDSDARHWLSQTRLNLAGELFHSRGASQALAELDLVPTDERAGDYYLLRAQILDAAGRANEAADSINAALRAAPAREDLYFGAVSFLLKHKLYHESLDLLQQAQRFVPDSRQLQLAQAITLELLNRQVDSQALLVRMQQRWPEWDRPFLLQGILLEIQLKSADALPMLKHAIALGAETPEAYYYEALALTHAAPANLPAADDAIQHALALTSKDPYIYLLAGRISLGRRHYPVAIRNLTKALALQPTLIPAHYGLREAYRATGDPREAAELREIKRIAKGDLEREESPFSAADFLFAVPPPGS